MAAYFDVIVNFGLPLTLLIVAYSVGNYLERKHFEDIRAREARLQGFPVISFGTVPAGWKITSTELVAGSVVVSLDYFKRVIAGLRGMIGGRIKTYEPLLDRARRAAMLRMIEDAKGRGYDAVVNVRLKTSRLANARRNGKGTAGVEMLAFSTAVSFAGR